MRLIQARGTIGILVLVAAGAGMIFPDFLRPANLADIVAAGSFLGLIAIGQSLVIILGGFDLSVGSLMGLGTVIAAYAVPYGWVAGLLARDEPPGTELPGCRVPRQQEQLPAGAEGALAAIGGGLTGALSTAVKDLPCGAVAARIVRRRKPEEKYL